MREASVGTFNSSLSSILSLPPPLSPYPQATAGVLGRCSVSELSPTSCLLISAEAWSWSDGCVELALGLLLLIHPGSGYGSLILPHF